jgi:TfuA protein
VAEPQGVIFVGPSLGRLRPAVPGIEYRPPAARGDIFRVVEQGAQLVGLVDGVFGQRLSVSPREIRASASAGARLFGAASMGALRACECRDAMLGIGEIYAAFARGELTDDDEVAVTFDATGTTLLSYPLVQIRRAGALTELRLPEAKAGLASLLAAVKELPFDARSSGTLRRLAAGHLPDPAVAAVFLAALDSNEANVKQRDALALVERFRLELAAGLRE